MAPRPAPAVTDWQTLDPGDWAEVPARAKPKDQPNAGAGVLKYATDTLSNIPGSALKLAGGVVHSLAHPVDTAETLGKVVTGTAQNMTPGYVTPDRPGYSKEADAAWDALKDRYGSPHAFAESLRTDPVGVAADISAVVGGVSGLARGGAALADATGRLPNVASAASRVADVSGAISDATNPMNLVTKPAGYVAKAAGKGVLRSALPGIGGRAERYGATPATAILEQTSGVTPAAVRASAEARIAELGKQLEALTANAKAAGRQGDLTPARQVIIDQMRQVAKNNGLTDDLEPMISQLTNARPGFGGAVDATGTIEALQDPDVLLGMKRQFGKDYTKFDAAVPMKSETRKLGNKAYHELSTEFDRTVPGAEPINQNIQSLIPGRDAAQRADENAGMAQNLMHRATAPTGALTATLARGPAALIAQTALSSPAVKIGLARGAYGAGNALTSPITSRAFNATGVAGESADTIAKRLSQAALGGQQ